MVPDELHTTAGNLHVKRVDHLSLQWVIQNYFINDKHAYLRFGSPEFLFGGCSWRLFMFPNYERPEKKISQAEIYLERLDTDIKKHDVSFTIGIKNPDGSVYISKECTSSINAESKTATFDPTVIKLDSQSELFTKGQGHLTIFIEDLVLHERIMEEQSATPTGEVIFNEKNEICKQDDAAGDQAADDTDSHEGTYLFANSMKMSMNEYGCDVLFKGEDGFEIRVDRKLLMDRFPIFASLFRDDQEFENSKGDIIINELRANIFKDFLQYIYSEPMSKVNTDDVCAIYESSVKHKLKHLEKKSIEFIKKDMSVDTMFELVAIAIKHKVEIINCATDYFALHMQSILPTMTWKKFLKDNHIVANDLIIKALKKNCVIFNSIAENKLPKEQ